MRLVIALTVALSLCLAVFLIPVATSANSSFTHPGLVHIVQSVVREIAQPVKVQVNGLRPGTEYFYRVVDSGLRQSTGRFVTSAKQNTFAGLRFGVSGDWRGELAPYPSLADADDRQLDFFVALGDTIYADVPSPAVPKSQAKTLEEYRAKQDEAYSEILGLAYSIGLWGDVPYSDLQALTGVPNLIADMNSQHLAFSVHNGDLKGGRGTPGSVTPTTCVDALYVQGVNFFNALKAPAMFTPGDNDWTDCDSASNGGFNSLERLDHERQVFFSTPFSLGQRRKRQEVQTAPLCLGFGGSQVPCVENRRWTVGKVVYVTLNIQGSCNNLCDVSPDPAEYAARNAANIAWLNDSFDKAESTGAAAIMIISQANPVWNIPDVTTGGLARNPQTLVITGVPPELDGFRDFLIALRTRVIGFRKPVAYVHGDSHYPRIDKPFLNVQGHRLENFTRVETFGNNSANGTNDVNWIKVNVDSRSREVFSYQLQIVPANRTAVPAP